MENKRHYFKKMKNLRGNPIWSISTCFSNDILSINTNNFTRVALSATDITDIRAEFVADPFVIKHENKYYLFFEVWDRDEHKGVIGLAASSSGQEWQYEKVVLKEPFHLSYPYVFQYADEYYMLPECCESGFIKLYKAEEFPYKWQEKANLLPGAFLDPSLLFHNNKFWLFAGKRSSKEKDNSSLNLFYSDNLEYGWTEHPMSPLISNNINNSRPAGRIVTVNNEIYRFSQDGEPYYGKKVNAFKITVLETDNYAEEEVAINIAGTGILNAWNRDGMHHMDFCITDNNLWLVAVDGHFFRNINMKDIFNKIANKIVRYNRVKQLKNS